MADDGATIRAALADDPLAAELARLLARRLATNAPPQQAVMISAVLATSVVGIADVVKHTQDYAQGVAREQVVNGVGEALSADTSRFVGEMVETLLDLPPFTDRGGIPGRLLRQARRMPGLPDDFEGVTRDTVAETAAVVILQDITQGYDVDALVAFLGGVVASVMIEHLARQAREAGTALAGPVVETTLRERFRLLQGVLEIAVPPLAESAEKRSATQTARRAAAEDTDPRFKGITGQGHRDWIDAAFAALQDIGTEGRADGDA